MFLPLLLGCAVVFATMAIQIGAVVWMLHYLFELLSSGEERRTGLGMNTYVISIIMLMLFIGHLVQVAIWGLLFLYLGEFEEYPVAFYHSMVNFASLGYGDIVMSERWRMLGAIEASNGVLMFGLSAGTLLSVMGRLLEAYTPLKSQLESARKK